MFDVIVIGGGAAGLSAAQVLGRQRRSTLVLDAGQPRNAPSDGVHMFLSRDGFSPAELLRVGRDELSGYETVRLETARVAAVSGELDDFRVELADGRVERARRLVLATGQVDEPWDIPGLAERFGKCVFHCPFCHGYETTGKTLAVLGRDVPQVMLGLYVADRFGKDVVVLTDGAHELPAEALARLDKAGIPVRTDRVERVAGELDAVEVHLAGGEVVRREALFHRAPTRQGAPFAADLGCEILDDGCVRVDEFQATTVPGVSAAGDLARLPVLPDALTLVSQAAADGVRAAVWLEQGLFRAGLAGTEQA
ncbi:NAD(P)/FAD-dependent oxidoreductase [Amycolatopsis keratiniphila]|uniref:NAD(P)/FAD-dependent oxidoreductase n=1 Tax=Amycolatopsis keratiniphila TaxID=129921 RepID=UPI00087D50FC|nr:NAD(P)/FAD-dependent oxidoreductase [Amycolatopsis keratiniphila]OLZ58527.1 pyridine nucleotide-disulfide oxidoreductase [Amycolatopsis keratiniphila subsp. nogabecina]SDU00386.1 Thioredoxin reductase [Amycolatopsis keratiniphila]